MKGAMPICPGCGNPLRWKDSFSFWNPWNFPCPHCKVSLEASRIQKSIAFAVVPAGFLLAGIAILFEEHGLWQTAGGLAFFSIVVLLIVIGALLSWRHTRFTIKSGDD